MFKLFFLAGLVCVAQASVIASEKTQKAISPKEVDYTEVEFWVREFYDKCGQTDVVGGSSGNGVGTYRDEVVKRCIGDRPDCIADRNCYFAVAITETASYEPLMNGTGDTFTQYIRRVNSHNIKLLDTCHKPSRSSESSGNTTSDKFVGLTVGVFDSATKKPVCDVTEDTTVTAVVPTLDDFKAYFFVSDFTHCDIQTDTPVYPEFQQDPNSGSSISTISNEFEMRYTNPSSSNPWSSLCNIVKDRLPATFDNTKNSDLMKYFLVHYYGTAAYTLPNEFAFADVDVESKDNILLKPAGEAARVPEDENKESGAISFKPSTAFVSATLVLSAIIKSIF